MGMVQYQVKLTGLTPLIMHNDNISAMQKVERWRKDPANKQLSTKGDDRSPAWTWMAYAYTDRKVLGVPSDNLMTMLREGGAKVPTGRGSETYKKQTQAGINIDQEIWPIFVDGNGSGVGWSKIAHLWGETDFDKHIDAVEALGFELLGKRAKVGQSKHYRVRPMFREWTAMGTLTVLDDEQTGLTHDTLLLILQQAGGLVGLCDWRPSSPKSPGPFGKFTPELTPIAAAPPIERKIAGKRKGDKDG